MKLIKYLKLKLNLKKRMVVINEMMALKKMVDVYSEYVCEHNGWSIGRNGYLSKIFCELSFAFQNGYIKAIHDNGFEFQKGLVVKRDICEEMPGYAQQEYIKDISNDIRREVKNEASKVLRNVLVTRGISNANINTIVSDFEDNLN